MPGFIDRITLVKGDITKQADVDAVVCTTAPAPGRTSSLYQAVMQAGGPQLAEHEQENVYRPRHGEAFISPGFNLPVKHVIHVCLCRFRDGFWQEDKHLMNCIRNALALAEQNVWRRIAFPALGTGHDNYPLERAVRLSVAAFAERVSDKFDEVRIVCNRDDTYNAFLARLKKEGWKGSI